MPFDPNDLAAYVRSQRRKFGLTQPGLAERAKVPPAQVRRLESARSIPLAASIAIVRALDPHSPISL